VGRMGFLNVLKIKLIYFIGMEGVEFLISRSSMLALVMVHRKIETGILSCIKLIYF
jgi:hypothetical protein